MKISKLIILCMIAFICFCGMILSIIYIFNPLLSSIASIITVIGWFGLTCFCIMFLSTAIKIITSITEIANDRKEKELEQQKKYAALYQTKTTPTEIN